jgi:hypothetical protein
MPSLINDNLQNVTVTSFLWPQFSFYEKLSSLKVAIKKFFNHQIETKNEPMGKQLAF